ncbi:hypothetical protein EC973_003113 [Apophysomyces ossiformis]|uniref:Uncharacterized protein n=1 Tax=Apophysomyces ossiformis TaxID=679940 RepID=A0A8H7BMT2_9FUNG|nr:hypothetical protein EC973_003113 [Apophysomyces ossiformis]
MEDVTKEDIEAAIIEMADAFDLLDKDKENVKTLFDKDEPGTYRGCRFEVNESAEEMKPWYAGRWFYYRDDYIARRGQLGDRSKGHRFNSRVMNEWAERAWVVSERVIGVDNGKLLIHMLRTNAVFYYFIFYKIRWFVHLDPSSLFRTILNCKSTKYIDRLFAILPHTRHKDAVHKLLDEETTINDKLALKWVLYDLLDMRGRRDLLTYLIHEEKGDIGILPLSVKDNLFRLGRVFLKNRYDRKLRRFKIQNTTTRQGKRAIKFSTFFRLDLQGFNQLLDVPDGSIMKIGCICRDEAKFPARCVLICHEFNGIWKITDHGYATVEDRDLCKYGEFLLSL